jgi:hypothetical protein
MVSIDSIFTDFRDRAKNPFFATLFIVWVARNWELVYTVFNFDDECDLLYKQEFIRNYLLVHNFWLELLINLGYAIFFLLIGHFFKLFTDVLATAIRYRLKPHLNRRVSSKLIANTSDLERIAKQRDDYANELISKNDIMQSLEGQNTKLKSDRITLDNTISTRDEEISILEANKTILDNTILQLQAQIVNQKVVNDASDREINELTKDNNLLKTELEVNSEDVEILLDKFTTSFKDGTINQYQKINMIPYSIRREYDEIKAKGYAERFIKFQRLMIDSNVKEDASIKMSDVAWFSEIKLIILHEPVSSPTTTKGNVQITAYGKFMYNLLIET